jgi:8-amino-7-oxononanoate synthase
LTPNKAFDDFVSSKLADKESIGTLRSLIDVGNTIDFSSNDYLGFSTLPALTNILETLPSGATGSRSITGNHFLAEQTEALIAAFHQREAALIFNTGYMANIGLFSCIAAKGDTFISDEYVHASMIDGMRLSYANRLRFKHNDIVDLEKKLILATGKKIVVVESIYSMDGDEAPLVEIVKICKQYSAIVIVDEAHATGVYGKNGEGLVHKYHLQNEIYACIHTFGKALGLHGAAITSSKIFRQYLINQARSFIYTTALPPTLYRQIEIAYSLLPKAERSQLQQLVQYFVTKSKAYPNLQLINSNSAIQGFLIGENFMAKNLANYLIDDGFFVRAILSPTVPIGKERLRICLHSFNTFKQIDHLLSTANNFIQQQQNL